MSIPETGDVGLTGTCLMTFSGWPIWSCAATIQVHTTSAVNIRISFFIDIAFSPYEAKTSLLPPSLLQQLKTASENRQRLHFSSLSAIALESSIPYRSARGQASISSSRHYRSSLDTC